MYKELRRSKKSRVVAGVCGGLGEYFKVDPVVIRLIFIVFALANGVGVLAYIIFWILMPDEEGFSYYQNIKSKKIAEKNKDRVKEKITKEIKEVTESRKNDGPVIFGTILIVIGLMFLANNFYSYFNFLKLWPLIIVVIGVALLLSSVEGK